MNKCSLKRTFDEKIQELISDDECLDAIIDSCELQERATRNIEKQDAREYAWIEFESNYNKTLSITEYADKMFTKKEWTANFLSLIDEPNIKRVKKNDYESYYTEDLDVIKETQSCSHKKERSALIDKLEDDKNLVSNKPRKYIDYYYDIDGITVLIDENNLRTNIELFDDVFIHFKEEKIPKKVIQNKTNIIINDENFKLKDKFSIFLDDINTIFGKLSLYFVSDKITGIEMTSFFKDECFKRFMPSKSIHSFYHRGDSNSYFNFSLKNLVMLMGNINDKYKINCYLYGETFGFKYRFEGQKSLLNILNVRFKLFYLQLYKMTYFNVDICKNVRFAYKYQGENYFKRVISSVSLKTSSETGKNIFETKYKAKMYCFNQNNMSILSDYHCNNMNIDLHKNHLFLSKINMYNPISLNICNGLYKRKDIFQTNFANDIFSEAHNINISSHYRFKSNHQNKLTKKLLNNIKKFKIVTNYYRCEFKYSFNNKKRNYHEFDVKEIKEMFKILNIFNNKYKFYRLKSISYNEYVKKLYKNTKFHYKTLEQKSDNYIVVAKKIVSNVLFNEIIVRGGRQLHYLSKHFNEEIKNIALDSTFNTVISIFFQKFVDDIKESLIIIGSYVKKSNIDIKYKNIFNKIAIYFNLINNPGYKKSIFTSFLGLMQETYNISNDNLYSEKNHPITFSVSKNISIAEFWNEYIIKPLGYTSNGLRSLYYKYLIFAIKILKNYRNIENNDVNFLLNDVQALYIAYSIKNNQVYFNKVSKDKIPCNDEFKTYLTELILNKAKSDNAFANKRRDGFMFTSEVKQLYKYIQIHKRYNNDDFRNDTSLPFWLFYGSKFRHNGIKKAVASTIITDKIPLYLNNPEKNIIRFIIANGFFSKKVEINENKNFKLLMEFLIKLHNINYKLTKEDYLFFKKIGDELTFSFNDNINETITEEINSLEFSQNEIILYTVEIDSYIKCQYKLLYAVSMFTFKDFMSYFINKYSINVEVVNRNGIYKTIENIFDSEYFSKYINVEKLSKTNIIYHLKKLKV